MTHHHDDHHHHDHDDHDHHHHDQEIKSNLSFNEKMIKLLDHWIKHNADHAATYKSWAQKIKEAGLLDAALLIDDAAEMTLKISENFSKASNLIEK